MTTIIDSYSESNQTSTLILHNGNITKDGQTFLGDGRTLDNCKFLFKKRISPAGNAVVKIYAHSGTFGIDGVPTGSALATSENLDVSTLTTNFQLVTLNFIGANRIVLANGTPYCISVEYSGGDISNCLELGDDNTFLTHHGNSIYYQSGSWNAYVPVDTCFYVYGDSGFTNRTKNSTSFTNRSRNSTSFSNRVKGACNTEIKSPTATEAIIAGWLNPANVYSSDNQYARGYIVG